MFAGPRGARERNGRQMHGNAARRSSEGRAWLPIRFYGLLARKMLDLPITFSWSIPALDQLEIDALVKMPAAYRALALMQVIGVYVWD